MICQGTHTIGTINATQCIVVTDIMHEETQACGFVLIIISLRFLLRKFQRKYTPQNCKRSWIKWRRRRASFCYQRRLSRYKYELVLVLLNHKLCPVQTVIVVNDSFNYHAYVVNDSFNYHAYLNTNYHALSSTTFNYHAVWTFSNST